MGRYLELARRASQVSSGICTYERNEVNEERSAQLSDPYAERLGAAMREVAHPDYPAGMIPWLREAYPILHVELTEGLPNQMQRLWEAQVPAEEFQKVLDIWVEAHRMGCEMYEKHLPAKRPEAPR